MNKVLNYFRILTSPRKLVYLLLMKYPWLISSDTLYIRMLWWTKMNYPLNLSNPRTYNEKLQWLKLNYRIGILTQLVDKEKVKEYVAQIIGSQYIIPTLGVWDSFDDIDFSTLPKQFVLKCTHDSGGLVICKDSDSLDKNAARLKIETSLKSNFYLLAREWPYKNVPRKIIAEKYMEDCNTKELRDYKFFCFNGKPKWMFIASGRQFLREPYFDFFDMDFKNLPIRHGHPNSPVLPAKPYNFELMKELAMKLSKGFPHVRVDFYEINGKVYFGELTFFHHSGFVPFEPAEWDLIWGNELKLTCDA